MAILSGLVASPVPEKEAWATFAAPIDQNSLNRLFQVFSNATLNQFTHIHLLFQTAGGTVADGVALYNFFRTLPIQLSLHNVGTVASIGCIAFLGAPIRLASEHSSFMIHRTQISPMPVNSEKMMALANSLEIDDQRTAAILRSHIDLPDDKWKVHSTADLWMTASEAVQCKLATGIGEFSPPLGNPIWNI